MPKKFLLLCVVLGIFATMVAWAQTTAWDEKFYNPKPAEGDLVLPLPCGGAMVFRRVEVPTQNEWDDKAILLGAEDENLAYAEGVRQAFIGGGFAEPATPARRYFWIGKYEITQLQWKALVGDCPHPSMRGRIPTTGVNWFDAIQFAERYNLWLLKNALKRLPKHEGVPGFVRLPTETEWEYAARGGATVSEETFQARTFPTPEGLNRYVWYQGSESAGGKLHPTGLLQPNPLGLYDMLGNAEEIVLEPFRLSLPSRLHGQAGGFVTKGGHYFTGRADIRSAYRREHAPFDPRKGAPTKVQTVGFRLVIGGQNTIPNPERLTALRKHWGTLPPALPLADKSPDDSEDLGTLRRRNTLLKQALAGYQGTLSVRSEPPGMSLMIDGEAAGVTPIEGLKRLSGRYRIELTDPEGLYLPYSAWVELKAAVESKVQARMAWGQGALTVISEPPGMRLRIDGEEAGVTPVEGLKGLSGRYQTIELTDPEGSYLPYSAEVKLEAADESRVQARMERGTGRVVLVGEERGVVGVNGEYRSDAKAPGIIDVPTGEILVEIQSQNKGFRETLRVRHGEEIDLPYSLRSGVEVSFESKFDGWEPRTGIKFVRIPGGCYAMGSKQGDADEQPVHEVCVDEFWLGKTEVTQGQWREVIGNNPSHFKNCGDDCPVEQVSWDDSQYFIRKLNEHSGQTFRLPTEAEWEYACRSGGKKEIYAGGESASGVAWYNNNSNKKTHRVATKATNGLGLYDMSGNVSEWVQDRYDEDYYNNSPQRNPVRNKQAKRRVVRGGSWIGNAQNMRCANRFRYRPGRRGANYGFRLARPAQANTAILSCQAHLKANRLTIGKSGNAADCFAEILKQDPSNPQAKEGMAAIEDKYTEWAESAIKAGQTDKARGYIAKIDKLNPENKVVQSLKVQLAQAKKVKEEREAAAKAEKKRQQALTEAEAKKKQRETALKAAAEEEKYAIKKGERDDEYKYNLLGEWVFISSKGKKSSTKTIFTPEKVLGSAPEFFWVHKECNNKFTKCLSESIHEKRTATCTFQLVKKNTMQRDCVVKFKNGKTANKIGTFIRAN